MGNSFPDPFYNMESVGSRKNERSGERRVSCSQWTSVLRYFDFDAYSILPRRSGHEAGFECYESPESWLVTRWRFHGSPSIGLT